MKIKHLFLTAVAAITLAACGNQSSQQSSEASKATEAPAQTVNGNFNCLQLKLQRKQLKLP